MLRATLIFTNRLFLTFLHLLAGLSLLAVALLVLAIWKFSQGPVDITFAADYVRESFRTENDPVDVKFSAVVITWPDLQGSPAIDLSDFTILENSREKMHIGEVSLKVSLLPLLIGQIKPESILLRNPVIRVTREEDGAFSMFLSEERDDVLAEAESKAGGAAPAAAGIAEFGEGLFLGGVMPDPNLRIFSNLKTVNINNAKLVTRDKRLGKTWVVPAISLALQRSEEKIKLQIQYRSPGQTDVSALDASVEREKAVLKYGLTLRNIDLALFLETLLNRGEITDQPLIISGVIDGRLNRRWEILSADMALRSPAGEIRLGDLVDKPVSYRNFMVNLAYDEPSERLSIRDTQLDIDGATLSVSGERGRDKAGRAILPLRIFIPELTLAQIAALWPEDRQQTLAAEWLVRKLTGATLSNLELMVRLPIKEPATLTGRDVEARFDFKDLKADYRAPLYAATEARGKAVIKDDTLTIDVAAGKIKDLEVSKGRITIGHLTAMDKVGEAVIDLEMSGSLKTVFDYISLEPISLGKRLGMDTGKVLGRGDYHVLVRFPAIADLLAEQVKVKVESTLQETRLPAIVHGLDLSGGPFSLLVDGGAFTLSGKGLLDKTPIELTYSEYLDSRNAPYVSEIKASLETDEALRAAFGINLGHFVSGLVPAEILYKEPKPGEVSVLVKADLTPATAYVTPLNYFKKPGEAGSATCKAILKNQRIQKISDLDIVIGDGKTSGATLVFGQVGKEWDVASGYFPNVGLGNENRFSLKFTQPRPNFLDLALDGERLDARSFLSPESEEQAAAAEREIPAVALKAVARILRTGDEPDQIVRNATVQAEVNSMGLLKSLNVSADADNSPFRLSLNPDAGGKMKLRITAANAGKTLYAFDVYDSMIGGTMIVEGAQISGGLLNDIKGSATIRDFSIVKAPALAQLINGLSLTGFAELLQNKGIAFSKLKTDFVWKKTSQGRVINLSNGRTSGASIGLSFGGVVNQTKGTMDLSGTFVPMSGINKVVGSIPLIGHLLTGGKDGGIIAATYAMKGDSDNPRVFINPLSVLAPGFLRSILFENGFGGEDDEEEDSDSGKTRPPKTRGQYN